MRAVRIIQMTVMIAGVAVLTTATFARAAETSKSAQEGLIRANAEGIKAQATYLQAQAQMVNAISQARKAHAEVRKTLLECRSLALENEMKVAETFYKKREARDKYLAAHPRVRPTQEEVIKYSKSRIPQRLNKFSLTSTGTRIQWPAVLRRPEFDTHRLQLEVAFASRSFENCGLGSELHRQACELTCQMREELRRRIREMSPMEYVVAKRFLESLAYEAQLPFQVDGLAAN